MISLNDVDQDDHDTKVTRRSFIKAVGAVAAVLAVGSQVSVLNKYTPVVAQSQEEFLTGMHDGGPFIAHVKNGRWIRSLPIEPNLPVGHNVYAVRNRMYAADRVRYPLRRVDFDPSGNRNPQNRGKSQYVRITWDEALTIVANELTRVKNTYGPSSVFCVGAGHQWAGNLHNRGGFSAIGGSYSASGWASRFFNLFGGATGVEAESSYPGWDGGGAVITGTSAIVMNNAADIAANTKLIIHWSSNPAIKSYVTYRQNLYLRQFKELGIRQILIDPYFNETGALYCDKWIPIKPGTDEALMAAIANVWIGEGLYDANFVSTHTVGFDKFKDYVTGVEDGVAKTPEWAEGVTGVEAETIRTLAHDWASQPTIVSTWAAAAQRRDNGPNFVRMLFTLCAMLGYFGKPGAGLISGNDCFTFTSLPSGKKLPGSISGKPDPVTQLIRHGQFGDAILNPPISWTVARTPDGTILKFNYPEAGSSEVHLIFFPTGTGRFLNQTGGTNRHVQALQNPKVEFVYCHAAWWEASPKFSDIILPVKTVGERDDIGSWQNYIVYMHTLGDAAPEAMNDMDVFVALAGKLGFADQLTEGKTADQWLQQFYSAAAITDMTYDQFKAVGYYKYPFPAQTPSVNLAKFHDDPANNKLTTPSGKIEIYSQRVADAISSGILDAARESTIPKYIPSQEGIESIGSQKYPLYLVSSHHKFARHSQWQNLSWHRDEYQMKVNGYQPVLMNPVDAQARGLKEGQAVKVFNDRGTIVCGVHITEKMMPGVVCVFEGGWYTPQQPGVVGSIDLGGDANLLISGRTGEPITSGLIAHTIVDVTSWSG